MAVDYSTINVEELQKKKLFIATPMYGGICSGYYTKAISDLSSAFQANGITFRLYYLFNESLITRARNYCVDEFLRSDCSHMLFIDSDIAFDWRDVFKLLDMCDEENGYDIVTGPYPKKTIAWEKIKRAVDKGFANENPFQLDQFVGDYVFNPVAGTTSFRIDTPVEIQEGGTGFMMIHRKVFEDYAEAYPELKYKPDHARTKEFDGSREITAFFDCVIDPESKRYLSEDYMFSQYARKIGKRIWLCPWMRLVHIGSYAFGGSLSAIAAIDASPTSSKGSNPKDYIKKDLTTKSTPATIPQLSPNSTRQQRRAAESKQRKGK